MDVINWFPPNFNFYIKYVFLQHNRISHILLDENSFTDLTLSTAQQSRVRDRSRQQVLQKCKFIKLIFDFVFLKFFG